MNHWATNAASSAKISWTITCGDLVEWVSKHPIMNIDCVFIKLWKKTIYHHHKKDWEKNGSKKTPLFWEALNVGYIWEINQTCPIWFHCSCITIDKNLRWKPRCFRSFDKAFLFTMLVALVRLTRMLYFSQHLYCIFRRTNTMSVVLFCSWNHIKLLEKVFLWFVAYE